MICNSGAFAIVRLAADESTKLQYACKMVRKCFVRQKGFWQNMLDEIKVMQELSHVGHTSESSFENADGYPQPTLAGLRQCYEDEDYFYLMMDL